MSESPLDTRDNTRRLARTAGLLYVIVTVGALFGEMVVRGKLLHLRDPALTAANILSHDLSAARFPGFSD
jgi:hypothetical protein